MWTLLVCAVCSRAKAPTSPPAGEVHRTIQEIITSNNIVVFSRTNCKESDKVKAMLEDYGLSYVAYELDQREDGQGIASHLGQGIFQPTVNPVVKALGQISVVPAVFVRGSPVSKGALSASHESGELEHWASDNLRRESEA
mmetsp:Transcript_4954/g.9617  ORF Transcript_4954/g.9617 Transcript_4954/m.9617 type:complete len:141 (-) Transcript_4954:145-567(-)